MNERILVVEDEQKIARLLQDYLNAAGFAVDWLDRADGAVKRVMASEPALVVLDRMLPGGDGLELCRTLRRQSSVPVIMLTARVDEADRLDGFEAGADDYLCKPFSPAELVARVRSVLRRTGGSADDGDAARTITLRGLVLDTDAQRCTLHGTPIELTPVEFRLLHDMLVRPGRVRSRYQLMRSIYEDHRVVSDRTIDSHVRNLRRKLASGADSNEGDEEFVRSRYGLGYSVE